MNHATIDLEEPAEADFVWMRELIGEFVAETGSVIGKRILDLWETEKCKFVKVKNGFFVLKLYKVQVFPKDYKKALKQMALEEEAERRAREEKENLRLEQQRIALENNTLQVFRHFYFFSHFFCGWSFPPWNPFQNGHLTPEIPGAKRTNRAYSMDMQSALQDERVRTKIRSERRRRSVIIFVLLFASSVLSALTKLFDTKSF